MQPGSELRSCLLPAVCWLAPGPREQTAAFPVCSLGPGTPSKQVSFPSFFSTIQFNSKVIYHP
uniref:Uncharacterized protein n=1 Tax=Gopherus evgoodei TaxID=1825980 RepID=A0A8C4W1J8_9SAUR